MVYLFINIYMKKNQFEDENVNRLNSIEIEISGKENLQDYGSDLCGDDLEGIETVELYYKNRKKNSDIINKKNKTIKIFIF